MALVQSILSLKCVKLLQKTFVSCLCIANIWMWGRAQQPQWECDLQVSIIQHWSSLHVPAVHTRLDPLASMAGGSGRGVGGMRVDTGVGLVGGGHYLGDFPGEGMGLGQARALGMDGGPGMRVHWTALAADRPPGPGSRGHRC